MNRNEFLGKLNALYVGDKNCLEELLTAYDEKDEEIERLIISLQAQEELTMNEHIKVERLNNIINELEKWLEDKDKNALQDDNYCEVLDKLQELKRVDK